MPFWQVRLPNRWLDWALAEVQRMAGYGLKGAISKRAEDFTLQITYTEKARLNDWMRDSGLRDRILVE